MKNSVKGKNKKCFILLFSLNGIFIKFLLLFKSFVSNSNKTGELFNGIIDSFKNLLDKLIDDINVNNLIECILFSLFDLYFINDSISESFNKSEQ